MKIITLNTWGGRVQKPLFNFLSEYSKEVDIFCFQEFTHNAQNLKDDMHANLFSETSNILKDFNGFFRPAFFGTFGLAIFVKKTINIGMEGDIFVFRERGSEASLADSANLPRNFQYVTLGNKNTIFSIFNLHGLWNGKGKTDTEDRIAQSQKIVDFMKTIKGPKILCGDYNLLPDTKSLKILEDFGMRNLVKEFGVINTRTPLYTRGGLYGNFADYILITQDMKVKDFKVLPDVVSDHAPLFLDFELM